MQTSHYFLEDSNYVFIRQPRKSDGLRKEVDSIDCEFLARQEPCDDLIDKV
jgi:hypothetical protein